MRRIFTVLLLSLLLPSVGWAGRGYYYGPPRPSYGYGGPGHYPYSNYGPRHDHRDVWIPLAIVGGVLGVIALSQMDSVYSRPVPPQRICRDTYNYYDQNGQFMYSRYVDRPCRN